MKSRITNIQPTVAICTWLRWPSILLGSIGVWGILNAKLKVVTAFSGFFNLPPLSYSYAITGLAAILFSVAIFYRPTNKIKTIDTTGRHLWRGQ